MIDQELLDANKAINDPLWFNAKKMGPAEIKSPYFYYPKDRLVKYSCIVAFANTCKSLMGVKAQFAWVLLTEKQRVKLLNTKYLDKALQVDLCKEDGIVEEMRVDEFKKWLVQQQAITEKQKAK